MTSRKYILEEGKPRVEPDLIKWAEWFEDGDNRRVDMTMVGDSKVSTVFLALDHNFSRKGPPILWETMVFGGELDNEQDRCSGTMEQAEAMHKNMVERVKAVQLLTV
jgi:hypothetical protein